jgi:hypothetical protein
MGRNTAANGIYSLAFGINTVASSANSIALGTNATTSAVSQFQIGSGTNITQVRFGDGSGTIDFVNTLAIAASSTFGSAVVIDNSNTASPNNVVNFSSIRAIGDTTNVGLALVPKGTGAFSLAVPDGTAAGGNVRGANAIDLQTSRTAATQVASTSEAVAIGSRNVAGGTRSVSIGIGNVAGTASTHYTSITLGFECQAGSAYSQGTVAMGSRCLATGTQDHPALSAGANCSATGSSSQAFGLSAVADRGGMLARASGGFSASGDAQQVSILTRTKTTDGVAKRLPNNILGNGIEVGFFCVIPAGKVLAFTARITGIKSDGTAVAEYVRKGVIKRVVNTTSLVGTIETIGTDIEDNPLTDVTIAADDTNDALDISVTGIAGETWRWVAVVEGVEIAYGT